MKKSALFIILLFIIVGYIVYYPVRELHKKCTGEKTLIGCKWSVGAEINKAMREGKCHNLPRTANDKFEHEGRTYYTATTSCEINLFK